MMAVPSRAELIACAKRELAMRRKVYPKWVAMGRMTQETSDHEIAGMAGIVDELQRGEPSLFPRPEVKPEPAS